MIKQKQQTKNYMHTTNFYLENAAFYEKGDYVRKMCGRRGI